MRARLLAAVMLGAALASAGAIAAPARKPAAAAARDWTRTVAVTPEGGFRMGNPAAPLKLVEYGSLTCPHCAHFDREGFPKLLGHVKTGRLSYELRNYVRDPYDLAAALISRCAGPRSYFPLTNRIFATQEQWTGRFSALSAADYDALEALPQKERIVRIAKVAQLDALATKFGVAPARARACLTDDAAIAQLTRIRSEAGSRYNLEYTPTFVLNGKKLDQVSTWSALEPRLKPPGS